MKRAVYAGSFDPVTKGHLWMIEEGACLFNELVVAVGTNPNKKPDFSLEERTMMLEKSMRGLSNVAVDVFADFKYLVHYTESVGAKYLLRGIRSEKDYEYERTMRYVNSDIGPEIETVFMIPPRKLAEVSSSLVKGLVGPEGWEDVVEEYLPQPVFNKFLGKYDGLLGEWNALWERLDVQVDMRESYDVLKGLYSNPGREYHNMVHLWHCLNEFSEVKDLLEDPEAVEVALWFHDSVYDVHSKDNEKRSAVLARETLGELYFARDFMNKVHDLIIATKHSKGSRDSDTRFMMDIDLAILGSPCVVFDEYELNIRDEYSHHSDEAFRKGRARMLQGFLDRKNMLYQTDYFRNKYKDQAKKNLESSLKKLKVDYN